ncbi:head GIN domain-containing protein [Xanthomarina spongicola]|uniref:Putative autotransporter adhesin-like protein n=1 Tax=Xanthomarina spongicola TaxID=570520 RepID=A0A316DHK1_9FLAO|nr:head GIN domain-containing protein [Xanthomarina spongicola]PWK17375.1 putative autotransporter adhesin-like protein [Xanthomarina spongicola]
MKKIILIAAVLLSSFSFAQKVNGNGKVTTITRTTGDYDGIKCAGSFDYILVAGTEGKITLEGEENLLEYVITEVKGNNLIIKVKDKVNLSPSMNKTIKITIPFKDINSVSLAGSGDLWNEDKINATNFDVSLAGSGDVNIHVDANSISSSLTGSGDLNLKGNTEKLEVSVSGSGDFDGSKLESNYTDVSLAGSGDAEVVSNKSLKARVAGSGDIEYSGNPEKEDTKVAGSGSISKNN